jgi:antitoxin component of RelBE/YafQ-DinJ toxin-antitoxin module
MSCADARHPLDWMPRQPIAIRRLVVSVPEDVLHDVDAAATSLGLTRSELVNLVLRRVASVRRDAEITRRIDHVMRDLETQEDLAASARHLAAARRDEGWEW